MTADVLPDPSTPFGRRVRERLRDERVLWVVTVGADGTPQPNPVWFVWDGGSIVVYNDHSAHRLGHIRRRPQVSLHLNSTRGGGDVVVLNGTAEIADGMPAAHENPLYMEKYGDDMVQITGSPEAFSTTYSVPTRIRIDRVRGFVS